MNGENPCNICHADCRCALGGYTEYDGTPCIFYLRYNRANVCEAYDCFVNYEGSCLLSLYDDCGCRRFYDGKV